MCGIAPPLRTETKIVGSGAIFPPPLRFPALRVHHPGLGNRCHPLTEVGESRGDRETGQVLGCRHARLASNQYIRGNFPARSGPGTLTVSGAESAVSHIIPGDDGTPKHWGGQGRGAGTPDVPLGGWDSREVGDQTRTHPRWPCHTYEQDNWCHRTEAPCEPPGATSERPRVGASRLSDGCPAARNQSLPSVPKLRRGLSPRLRRLEGSVFS